MQEQDLEAEQQCQGQIIVQIQIMIHQQQIKHRVMVKE